MPTESEAPHAIELFHQDGHSAQVWYCSKCRCVAKTKEEADRCCGPRFCSCGATLHSQYAIQCNDCDNRKWKEQAAKDEAERFAKATKIAESDWAGEQCYYNDHYFDSPEEFREWAENEFSETEQLPAYIWNARNQGVRKANREDLIDDILSDLWEDAAEDDLNGITELQAAIDAFNQANESVCCWMVDFSTAIVLSEASKDAAPASHD